MKLSKPFYTAGRRFWQRTGGMSAVEMALILPIFLLCLCGAVDFGNLYVKSNLVSDAAATGAQAASYSMTGNPPVPWTQGALQTKLRTDYSNNNLTVAASYDSNTPPNVTVTVTTPVNIINPMVSAYFHNQNPVTLTGTCTRVTEY
jgi:Flp pilus assembly protein TadG